MGEAQEAIKELNENLNTYKEQLESRVDEHGNKIEGFDEELEAKDEKMQELEGKVSESMKKVDELALENQRPSTPESEPSEEMQKLFGKQLKEIADRSPLSIKTDTKLSKDELNRIKDSYEERSLVEDIDDHNLVPKEIQDQILREVKEDAVLRPLMRTLPINSNRSEIKNLNADVQMSYGQSLEAGGDMPGEDTPSHGNLTYYVEDLKGLAKIGKNLIQDSIINLAQEVQDAYVEAKAEIEDEMFMTGSGHSSEQPEGLIQAGSDYELDLGSSKPTFDDLLDLMFGKGTTAGKLKSPYRTNGVFLMHSFTALYMMKQRITSAAGYDGSDETSYEGAYMWQPSLQAGTPNTFRGKPVYTHDNLTAEGSYSEGDYVAIFGDLNRAARIIERQGLEVQTLTEKYAESGQVGYLFHARNSSKIERPEALRLLTY